MICSGLESSKLDDGHREMGGCGCCAILLGHRLRPCIPSTSRVTGSFKLLVRTCQFSDEDAPARFMRDASEYSAWPFSLSETQMWYRLLTLCRGRRYTCKRARDVSCRTQCRKETPPRQRLSSHIARGIVHESLLLGLKERECSESTDASLYAEDLAMAVVRKCVFEMTAGQGSALDPSAEFCNMELPRRY